MNIFQIGLTPMGYFYQRLSKMINRFSQHKSRYYTNASKWRNSPYFDSDYIDLSELNFQEEIIDIIEKSDLIIFHQTKNYFRKIKCIDGDFDVHKYLKGKRIFIFIHGQPETHPQNIYITNRLIDLYKNRITFFVVTPNQLNIFDNVKLFPIIGLFESANKQYQPHKEYLKINRIKITRYSDWKALMFDSYLMDKLVKPSADIISTFKQLAIYYLPFLKRTYDGFIQGKVNGSQVVYANLTKVRNHKVILNQLKNTDILLENDIFDYPGGGTTHTIGLEGLAAGAAIINGALKANIRMLADWLETDKLPPFPNWENEKDFHLHHIDYLNRLIQDKDLLREIKSKSRKYFEHYMSAEKVMPKVLKLLEH